MRYVEKGILFLALFGVWGCFNLNVKVPPIPRGNTEESAAPGAPKGQERVVVNAPGVHVDVGVGGGEARAKKIQASRWYNSAGLELKKLRGHYVVLHFFLANDERSREEVLRLVYQSRRWSRDGVVVIGIHPSRETGRLERLIKQEGVTYPVALDNKNDTVEDYKITSYPSTILIDPEGRVILWAENLEAVKARLEKLLTRK